LRKFNRGGVLHTTLAEPRKIRAYMSKPIHALKGNSLWARIDNFKKYFVITRAHSMPFKL